MATAVPDHHRSQIAGILQELGITLTDDPHDPTIHTFHHQGADWTATYWGALEGEPNWTLVGPPHPDGIALDIYGIRGAVTKYRNPGATR